MDSEYILEISFLSFRETTQVNQLKFNGQIYDAMKGETLKINIPPLFFDENETKTTSINLFKSNYLINECILEIFQGYNHFYCFLDEKGYTIELLFNKILPNIRIPIYNDKYCDITKFDTNKTLNRKRFSLLNFNHFSICINNEFFSIPSFVSKVKSYQLSVYDLKEKIVVSKPLLTNKNENTFFEYYNKYISSSSNFMAEIKECISQKNFRNIKYVLPKYKKLKNLSFYFNQNRKKLENSLNEEKYIDFYANISYYNFINSIINNSNKLIKEFIGDYTNKIKEIKEDGSLKIYQKILIINALTEVCCQCKTKNEIATFSYYLMNVKDNNSVLDFVEKFFKQYRDELNENSPIFEKLIELDGSPGVYNNELYYCYNMQNIDELKKHLKELETSILCIHELNNKIYAITHAMSGIVSINVKNIKQYKSFDIGLNKEIPKDKMPIGKIIASKIVYFLLHEINGHKKNKIINSPIKFFENGNIFSLCNKN